MTQQTMVSFGHELEGMVWKSKESISQESLACLNMAAETAVNGGGICDEKVFMTAFWGGVIAKDFNWGNSQQNERVRVDNSNEKVDAAFGLAKLVGYAVGEPYLTWDDLDTDCIDQIGLVLPGAAGGSVDQIAFRVSRRHSSFIGSMSFRGFQIGRKYGKVPHPRIEDVVILEVEREKDDGHSRAKILNSLRIGAPALREQRLGYRWRGCHEDIDGHIRQLRTSVGRIFPEELVL